MDNWLNELRRRARLAAHKVGHGAHRIEHPVHMVYFGALFLHVEWYYLLGGVCFVVTFLLWVFGGAE